MYAVDQTISDTSDTIVPQPGTAIQQGRQDLAQWRASIPDNFFHADVNLHQILQMYRPDFDRFAPDLAAFGEAVATVIDVAATVNDRPDNHPRYLGWDGIGQPTEEIEFHPTYHTAGRPAYAAGLLALQQEPGHALQQAGLFYLLSQAGEMGHACPLVCTMGMIRALQQKGSPDLQARYLPPLLDADYDRKQTASQFLTEVQGGSDVGANASVARPHPDQPGAWLISGEKWFCSVANADQFLVTARPQGAVDGTRGLGCFLIPRRLPDGRLNNFSIRRLKTKFGTRTMASAEMDFAEAVAYPIGKLTEGFAIAAGLVLNTSRWANALGSAGLLRRAYVEAWTFAQARSAFGHPIADYPMVQEALVEMKSDLWAMLASSLRLTHLLERMDTGDATPQEEQVFRLLVNLNKYWTSIQASLGIRRAQEILGGNGAIEDFSVIPRLYRDAVVFESWEGSHNVLCLQVVKDMTKYALHRSLFAYLRGLLDGSNQPALTAQQDFLLARTETVAGQVERLLAADGGFQQTHGRRILDGLAALIQAVCLLAEAEWALGQGWKTQKPAVLAFFVNRYLRPDYDPVDDAGYAEGLQALAGQL